LNVNYGAGENHGNPQQQGAEVRRGPSIAPFSLGSAGRGARIRRRPVSIEFFEDPFPIRESLREAGPVVWLSRLNGPRRIRGGGALREPGADVLPCNATRAVEIGGIAVGEGEKC
jgi:hypothetical protein